MIDEALAALRRGEPVVLPFDTVYGLAAEPHREESTRRLYEVKGRPSAQPTALVAASVAQLGELVPELDLSRAWHLLPGPLTLVVPNPAGRFHWLTGTTAQTLGVRVPDLTGPTKEILEAIGAVVATSANLPGEPDPRRLADVPPQIRDNVAAAIDGGELPGTPSTVVDLTGDEPRVLRAGAVSLDELQRRLGAPVRSD